MLSESHPRLATAAAIYARVAAVLVGAVGVAVIVGWAAGIETLKSLLHPNRVAMNPATAVAFILGGASLWCAKLTAFPNRVRPLSAPLGGLVALIGLLKLMDILTGGRVPVDRLLFPDRLGDNVMAPNTAVGFVLAGLSLLVLDLRRRRTPGARPATVLALGTAVLALVALMGYTYGVRSLYRVGHSIDMALNTVLSFLLLSTGILCSRPARQPLATIISATPGGVVARRLLPAAFFIPLLIGYLRLRGERAGYYDSAAGVMLFTLATIAVFVILVWWISRLLYRADRSRRQAEEELRQSEAVYHSLVETLPQNIFRKDLQGRFTFANHNFCQALGRPLSEIVGKTDLDFYPRDLAERYRADDRSVIETGRNFETIERHVTADGQRLHVHVIKSPVRMAEEGIVGTQGIFWDVTEQELAREAIGEKNLLLQDAVRSEREAREALEKAQATLVQTEKLAGLGQMVAGVAHEINNPLSFVSNNVAVLQRDLKAVLELLALYREGEAVLAAGQPDLMARVKEACERIDLPYTVENIDGLLVRSRDGLKRIQQIVKDLREFARLDRSDYQEADLNAGIESTINIIRGHAKKKQVQIETEPGPLPPVSCFPAKVNQVIMNLLTNAIDASPDHGKVLVRTRAEGAEVRIEVRDQGKGIPPELRARIFDPFFTTKPPGQGTGLGLSISYGIVHDHGGHIEVQSEMEKGSVFCVVLPLRNRSAGAPPAGKRNGPPGEGQPVSKV